MKPAGSFAGYGGRCAQFRGGSVTAGTPVISSTCGSSWTSFWLSWFSQITVSPDNGQSRVSWNISGGTVSNTTPTNLIAWPFGDFANQQFPLTGMRWKALGDMCVGVNRAADGEQLRIQPCGSGSGSELWSFWTTGTSIQLTGTNLCVTEPHSPAAIGDVLKLTPCNNSPAQNLSFATAHQVRDPASNLCANVFGGFPDPGALVGMWNGCDAVPAYQNEQFHMTGHVVGLGQCAAWNADALADGTGAQVRKCTAAPAAQALPNGSTWLPTDPQDWDVYWP
jgi:hypothetical protein